MKRGVSVQLSNRQIQVVTQLITATQPVTTAILSEQLNVSVRTVKNDLKVVQAWLDAEGPYYQAKPRIGIWLEATPTERAQLKRHLLLSRSDAHSCTPQERIEQIVLLLSSSSEFITTQQIENKIAISKNTVVADLDKVERFLKRFQLLLERKNYYGYRIAGPELNVRSAVEAVLNRTLATYEAPLLAAQTPLQELRQIQFVAIPEVQTVLNVVVTALETCTDFRRSDFDVDDILTMLMRLTISAMRLSMHHPINSRLPLKVATTEQQKLPYAWFVAVMQHYDFARLQDEYNYLLRGVNPRFDDQNIAHLSQLIINEVSHQLQYPFDTDRQLRVNLFAHLLTKLSNKYKFTNEYNPFVTDLKKRNLPLFKAVQRALQTNISSNPAVVNESFVAFVTLHFLVSLEGHTVGKRARVIYVCSTGLGVTGLIKREIERQIANVEIAGFASLTTVQQQVTSLKPDLVISIFPITVTQVPVIQVNPLPSATDIQRIKQAIAKVLNVAVPSLTPVRLAADSREIEEQVRTVMLSAGAIYSALAQYLGARVPATYQEAFMIHVMMAVERLYFHHNYDGPTTLAAAPADVQKIKQIFAASQLTINEAEIKALLQYTQLNISTS